MEEIDIKEFLNYLKRFYLAFIIAVFVAVSGVLVYNLGFKKSIYQAKTTIVIAKSNNDNNSTTALNDINASQKLTSTYAEIAKSELVLNRVATSLDLAMDAKELKKNVSVEPVTDTSIISVSVKDADAERSAKIANEIAKMFTREIKKIYKLDNVSQLSVAETPTTPANNTLARDMIFAFMIAVFGTAGLVFLKFYFDDTVKHNDDIEKLFGLSVAGNVMKGGTKAQPLMSELVVERMPKSMVSENIKSLRTNLQFTSVDNNLKTILVTSTNAGEGKSFVSANLAVSFAQADKRVLLVDCDLRKGRVHRLLGLPNRSGFSNLLMDDLSNVRNYICNTAIRNLDVLTCGTYPPNPSELLSSYKNKRLIQILKYEYDIIIFDGAPVGGLADSVILSSLVDKTLIITKDANTAKNDLRRTKDELLKVGARIAGIVFNSVNPSSSKSYYNYYYGEQKA
ncbi:polysaccharide biosynthesis tyrosine autokinase [Candidatus Saccharibacteria bacterium]|nr:polysaccharide biosynthesis tyrosine autokinase [Candidatus Saccharibacteria bacterium]